GYAVTAVAWLYWSRYLSSFMTRAPSKKKEKAGPDSRASLKRLMGYMLPYTPRFIVVLALVVLSSYGEMAIPQYTGRMADWIINEEAPDAFSQAITIMTLLTFASAVFEFMCDLTYNVTMSLIHTSVQGAVFQAVLRQEIAFFDATSTGELVSRITTDTNEMSEALSEKLSLLMWYTARFGFLLFFMDSLAKANQVATETFSNMKTVRSFANEDGETEKYRQRLDETYSLNKQEAVAYAASTWANSMTTLALKVCILYYGGTLVTRGAVSSGDLVSFVLYELQFASAVECSSQNIIPRNSVMALYAGEKGGQVSGGQKQRIAIARALIRNPKILILDNATSDLDTENEYQVREALAKLAENCSVLMISNKMSVAKTASHIIVLNNGTVEEEGSHDVLMEKGGRYAEMVKKQEEGFKRPKDESSDEQ
ncbi:hypothetical protein GOODEAATRI_017902, partial [Goodea atripinnis]